MKIRLLKDKMEGNAVKTTVRRRRGQGIFWLKGTEILVSDETGKKLVKNGDAEEVVDVEQAVAPVVEEK